VERHDIGSRREQSVPEPLVIALLVIVDHVLADDLSKVGLAKRNDLVETLLLYGPHESLRMGIQVWAFEGRRMGLRPALSRTEQNLAVKTGSRSWMR
jgi:hypothetical protein